MTRRSLFALLLAPLAKYLPAKAKPPAGGKMVVDLAATASSSYTVAHAMVYFSNGEVYQSFGEAWEKISHPVHWHGGRPFVMFDQKESPWKIT